MNYEAGRLPSAWRHIAFCANPTWAPEPPDDFTLSNQRLLTQHYRVSQLLQDTALQAQSLQTNSQCESTDVKRTTSSQIQENVGSDRRSVKDVIPESRLARFYGEFFYDDQREKCYATPNERSELRYNGQSSENADPTECWMLPEVEYWFHKMIDDSSDRSRFQRRHELPPPDEDQSPEDADVAALAARLRSVRYLWEQARPRPPSPPPVSLKMRARRQQPRRLAMAPPPPAYCLDIPAQLFCHPTCKIKFDPPRPVHLTESNRGIGRLSRSHTVNASSSRSQPYRGTNVSRYAPAQRPARNVITTSHLTSTRVNNPLASISTGFRLRSNGVTGRNTSNNATVPLPSTSTANQLFPANATGPLKPSIPTGPIQTTGAEQVATNSDAQVTSVNAVKVSDTNTVDQPPSSTATQLLTATSTTTQLPSTSVGGQMYSNCPTSHAPSASVAGRIPPMSAAFEKRLYSTVLSMSAPTPINLAPVVRLAQKLVAPGLIKLNPKLVLSGARARHPQVDHKFEELEKEALEQYKASDESIDTKFRELEKEAQEQYSNSNTSCSSGNSAEKQTSSSTSATETNTTSGNSAEKQSPTSPRGADTKKQENLHKGKSVDSVVIYSHNFPDLNSKTQKSNAMNLKNFHIPPRGEKKEHIHRPSKNLKSLKNESQRAASDTDYEVRENSSKGNHKGGGRWSLPKKQRHPTLCVSDCSSDEELGEGMSMKDAGPRIKARSGNVKMSAHGGGDLHPIMRKT